MERLMDIVAILAELGAWVQRENRTADRGELGGITRTAADASDPREPEQVNDITDQAAS